MRAFFLLLLSACFVFGTACPLNKTEAAEKPVEFDLGKLSESGRGAYERLLKAETFEQGHVGYAGTLSSFVEDLNALLQEKAADEAFKSLLAQATPAGRLYALCGVYHTDYEFFLKETEKYKTSNESVQAMSGCEIFTEKVAKIVASDSPIVAIINPSQTFEKWSENNRKSFELDIAHGGFPAIFKSFAQKRK